MARERHAIRARADDRGTDASARNARLDEVCSRHGLDESARARLGALLESLSGAEHAPTSIRGFEQAVDLHVADSLVALELPELADRDRPRAIADLGAGAGFPGLPLAIALERSEVRLVESQERKCRFIDGLARAAGVANARAVCSRVEQWTEGAERCDLVLARALGAPAVALEYAAPLLREGGSLIDWRGRRAPEQEDEAIVVAGMLGLAREGIRRVEPFAGAHSRNLYVYRKVEKTPGRFPRRPGVARKRPLGTSDRAQR
jgi:16S rRNA (guanine527-N7)-methyltransferase